MATPEQRPPKTFSYQIISTKQLEVLSIVARGNEDGSYVDHNQIRERLSYKPSKAAVVFLIRYMIAQKRIEVAETKAREGLGKKQTGRPLRLFRLTKNGEFQLKSLHKNDLI